MLSNSLFKLMIYVNLLPNLLLTVNHEKVTATFKYRFIKNQEIDFICIFSYSCTCILKAWPFRIPPEILESAHWSDRACWNLPLPREHRLSLSPHLPPWANNRPWDPRPLSDQVSALNQINCTIIKNMNTEDLLHLNKYYYTRIHSKTWMQQTCFK